MWRNLLNYFKSDNLYTQALRESHDMLDLDLKMFQASMHSLRKRDDGSIDLDIIGTDKQINRFERDVRHKVLTHLAVSGPGDLAGGLILVSIIIDIERIGDYAKNIYDLSRHHPQQLHGGQLEADLASIESRTSALFSDTARALREQDENSARSIMSRYKEGLSADCESIVERIIKGEVPDLSTGTATAIALYVRYLKRIGAHSRNIVTSVVNPFPRLGYKEKQIDP